MNERKFLKLFRKEQIMSKHYKKLILLLIPACAGFCLALTLGSAEEPSELCHLCQNKALVLRAIDAMKAQNFDVIDELFGDYCYYLFGCLYEWGFDAGPDYEEWMDFGPYGPVEAHVSDIIAEGDIVVVRYDWSLRGSSGGGFCYRDIRMYRIAYGKIVQVWHGHSALNIRSQNPDI